MIYVDSEEVYLKSNVYDFSVDYNATDKSNILNIHEYLIIKIVYKMFGFITGADLKL